MIGNHFYSDPSDPWWNPGGPSDLLKALVPTKINWLREVVPEFSRPLSVLDVGSGPGFFTVGLARAGHQVTAVDASAEILAWAKDHDDTKSVTWVQGDAATLPFPSATFDLVCAMDFLEHVTDPRNVIKECARVLKPGGSLAIHTFNRNPVSHLVAIKLVEWLIAGTPRDMHVIELFIKPSEVKEMFQAAGLSDIEWTGVRPVVTPKGLWHALKTRRMPDHFKFALTRSRLIGYMALARRH